jgi:hypothetical protein
MKPVSRLINRKGCAIRNCRHLVLGTMEINGYENSSI